MSENRFDGIECKADDQAKCEKSVELYFDGEAVPMMPFIEEILYNITHGMVSALKGYEEGSEVVIKIK